MKENRTLNVHSSTPTGISRIFANKWSASLFTTGGLVCSLDAGINTSQGNNERAIFSGIGGAIFIAASIYILNRLGKGQSDAIETNARKNKTKVEAYTPDDNSIEDMTSVIPPPLLWNNPK